MDLSNLKPRPLTASRVVFTKEDGEEVIAANRRGVTMVDIAAAMGVQNCTLYVRMARWALRYADITKAEGK